MNKNQNWIVFFCALILLINGVFIEVLADDDHHNSSKKYKKTYISPVINPTYEEECSACHFAYQPELLPSGSWKKIMAGLDDHFEEELEIDTESINAMSEYLISNSSEKSVKPLIFSVYQDFRICMKT